MGARRGVHGFGGHTEQANALASEHRHQIEKRILNVATQDIAGHVLGGWHVFERRAREQCADLRHVGQWRETGDRDGDDVIAIRGPPGTFDDEVDEAPGEKFDGVDDPVQLDWAA